MLSQEQLAEIQKALENAHLPYKRDENTGDILDFYGETVADFVYHEEDAHLIVNAPTWIQQLLETVRAKDAEIQHQLAVYDSLQQQWGRCIEDLKVAKTQLAQKDAEIDRLQSLLNEVIVDESI